MEEMWLARDKDGSLWLFVGKPKKYSVFWNYKFYLPALAVDRSLYPEVQWTDEEPTKVKLVIDK